ncbi:hypothetical protein ACIG3E_13565 [Streptomyces sp. NPDC053474]|uniref:hypothetical protein n=1 Tax=Streptomyces sp. NPDC053474 TaxID=3365704 RepID=UPI0037D86373
MSTAPAPEPRDPEGATPRQAPKKPSSALIFDDPLSQQSADDSDRGWGERPTAGGDSAADLARFLDEKPPHHI